MDLSTKLRLGLRCGSHLLTRRPTPIAIAWLITGRCNLDCTYCMWKHLRTGPELDTAQVMDMLAQQRRAGMALVSFTGGEPLLRDDMGAIIACAKQLGLAVKLNTNGTRVAARLDELRPLDLLQVSLDGPPDLHDALRGEGTAAVALGAIDAARRAGIALQVTTCLTRQNVHRLDEVLALAVERRFRLNFQVLSRNFVGEDDVAASSPDRQALAEALRGLIARKRRGGREARAIGSSAGSLASLLQRVERPLSRCDCAPVSATMLPDGSLIVCGNAAVHEPQDAVALGFSAAFAALSPPVCEGCECVGRLRIARSFELDPSVLVELLRI